MHSRKSSIDRRIVRRCRRIGAVAHFPKRSDLGNPHRSSNGASDSTGRALNKVNGPRRLAVAGATTSTMRVLCHERERLKQIKEANGAVPDKQFTETARVATKDDGRISAKAGAHPARELGPPDPRRLWNGARASSATELLLSAQRPLAPA